MLSFLKNEFLVLFVFLLSFFGKLDFGYFDIIFVYEGFNFGMFVKFIILVGNRFFRRLEKV